MEPLIIYFNMMDQIVNNIKPDIKFMPNGDIHLTSKVVSLLGIEEGDAIQVARDNDETYIYIHARKAEGKNIIGIARRPNKYSVYLRVRWSSLCREIIKSDGRATFAAYRVGDLHEIDGKKVLPIITRKNYATKRD